MCDPYYYVIQMCGPGFDNDIIFGSVNGFVWT